ncbi:MAG: hypothetical protein F6K50_52330 [Moorea sp. SIO3I7]|uniref:hypothetical protein n=1 Tax=Moorena sp. SIO3I8 TaxID=2607833 RepID=UPI0013BFD902|nr:hypothetical protein [Moorena sp. SIO3I8]NEO03581.1 hypothetical protein [Moorena sp. SIO3I7]NEO06755.1 hypothetical protein [Moorena sp. SIO3I8]
MPSFSTSSASIRIARPVTHHQVECANLESGIGNFRAVVKISEKFLVLSCCAFKLDIIQLEDKPCLDAIAHRGFLQDLLGAL